jgi:hypothetical protein
VVTPTVAGSMRMGFGIALGILMFGLLIAAIALVSLGIVNGTITWPLAESAQRFEGRGPAESVPLTLEGPVRIEWTASPISPAPCQFSSRLMTQNDPGFNVELARTMIDRAMASGIPRELDLPRRTDYVLHIESDCDWTLAVQGN